MDYPVTMTSYKKEGKVWTETYKSCDPKHVYEMLASNMSYHFIKKSDYAKRMRVEQKYTEKEITFTDADGQYKAVFIVDPTF